MPNKKVVLFADATCDLTEELAERYGVHLCYNHIILDGRDLKDSLEITPGEIFENYYKTKCLPKTACINLLEYVDSFRPYIEQGCEIVHINLGGAISNSYQNCVLAAKELGGVYPVDSRSLSTGSGHLVIRAAEMIAEGFSAAEISDRMNELTQKLRVSFVLDTLEFMHAGGRCSAAAKLGANLLSIKPSIEVNNADGSMGLGKKYRGGRAKVLPEYVRDQLAAREQIDPRRIFITHSGMEPETIALVRGAIEEILDFEEIFETTASCTISSHCGPNCLGILFMTK